MGETYVHSVIIKHRKQFSTRLPEQVLFPSHKIYEHVGSEVNSLNETFACLLQFLLAVRTKEDTQKGGRNIAFTILGKISILSVNHEEDA